MQPRVLVVDDDMDLAETLADGLGERGYDAMACSSSAAAAKELETETVDALVTDLRMPVVDGLGLLERSRAGAPERPVLVMTAYAAVETAVDAIRKGAYHYLTKPFSVDELALFLGRALEEVRLRLEARSLRAALREEGSMGSLVAASAAMREVFDLVARVADAATPVLLMGETGTGKTAIARALHLASHRAGGPFVPVNCAALPEALLESELFGHLRGAFTGATTTRNGLFVEAQGGTLLLDDIGELPLLLQAKLLRVLESGAIRAVGSSKERTVDVRVVAATHRDLRERARIGTFREDLLYRLDVVTIEVPALRHRREDIPVLAERFLASGRTMHPRSPVERIGPDAMTKLMEHSWPGNVRELAHAIERVVVLGRVAEMLPADLPFVASGSPVGAASESLGNGVLPIRDVQKRYATWALERLGGHKRRTAEALGVDVKTLTKWLNEDVGS
jgi:two-component system response regulator HydG